MMKKVLYASSSPIALMTVRPYTKAVTKKCFPYIFTMDNGGLEKDTQKVREKWHDGV